MTDCKQFFRSNKVYRFFDCLIFFVEVFRNVVCIFIVFDYFFTGSSKYEDIVIPYQFMDFYVCTIFCTESQRTI